MARLKNRREKRFGVVEQIDAVGGEQGIERDQRQADQSVGIAPFEAFEKQDTEPFALKAAGALQWSFAIDVGTDFLFTQAAEMNPEGLDMSLLHIVVAQAQAGQKIDPTAGKPAQLSHRVFRRVRFADDLSIDGGDLIGSDHVILSFRRDRLCLEQGQAFDQCGGRFTGQRRFVDRRIGAGKRDACLFEDFLAKDGTGGENKRHIDPLDQ